MDRHINTLKDTNVNRIKIEKKRNSKGKNEETQRELSDMRTGKIYVLWFLDGEERDKGMRNS